MVVSVLGVVVRAEEMVCVCERDGGKDVRDGVEGV